MATSLIGKVRKEFRQAADAVKAPQMQTYMKSVMPFHGVSSPLVKKNHQRSF